MRGRHGSGPGPYVVSDASVDPRVSGVPAVAAGMVGAYLGMPLTASAGVPVGALCVLPRAAALGRGRRGPAPPARRLGGHRAGALGAVPRVRGHRLRFELAIDAAEIGSFDWDLTTGRLVWDDRLVEIFGYERTLRRLDRGVQRRGSTPTTAPGLRRPCSTAIDACGDFEAEYRIVLPDRRDPLGAGPRPGAGRRHGEAVRLLGAGLRHHRAAAGDPASPACSRR